MPYLLMHHFDPDFDHTQLKPRLSGTGGGVDHYNMGYVQNVLAGQVLAEFARITPEQAAGQTRFVFETPDMPAGPGTMPDPANPMKLLAAISGYVFYMDGQIRVHDQLNIRRDVSFHTGNVTFVGDIRVHGEVKSGFTLKGRNIQIDETVGGSTLVAKERIVCLGGIKGEKKAVLRAAHSLEAGFAENAQLVAGRLLHIKQSVLHCQCYCGGDILVGGRLQGGSTYCMGRLLVGNQLGGGAGTITQVVLGRNPFMLLKQDAIRQALDTIQLELDSLAERRREGPASSREFLPRQEQALARKAHLEQQLSAVQERLEAPGVLDRCELVVEGVVRPLVEISIGTAQLTVDTEMERVRFRLVNGVVAVTAL
ncbi:MAG: FapA family protein [Desulfovibrio sp.]|nr:FapA family protein [Desulfovibrio sp.]MCA1986277.1 FapA family protein [Desulfovibrio sp.]